MTKEDNTTNRKEKDIVDLALTLKVKIKGEKTEEYSGRLTEFQDGLGTRVKKETGYDPRILRIHDAESLLGKFEDSADERGLIVLPEEYHELVFRDVFYSNLKSLSWKRYKDFGSPGHHLANYIIIPREALSTAE